MIKIEVNGGKIPWIVGIGTILFGILLGILLSLFTRESAAFLHSAYVVVLLIVGAGILLCLDGRNRRLTVEDSNLCYRNLFGKQIFFSLEEIGYCSTALENNGSRDYLKVYDLQGKILCKLEYHMKNCVLFLQYLLDNQVELKCSEKSDEILKSMIDTKTISAEEISVVVNEIYDKAKAIVAEWVDQNKKLSAEWKMGIVSYQAEQMSDKTPLWEQDSYVNTSDLLPEGYLIVMEGYLQKDGQYVLNKKNRAVLFYVPVVCVSQSFQVGEQLRIRYFERALEDLAEQLGELTHILPKNRYHTEMLTLHHELKEML